MTPNPKWSHPYVLPWLIAAAVTLGLGVGDWMGWW